MQCLRPRQSGQHELDTPFASPIKRLSFVLELGDSRLKPELSHELFKLGNVRLRLSRTQRFRVRFTARLARK